MTADPVAAVDAGEPPAHARIVVMGVCGAGKSTVGRQLASGLGVRFVDGDDLHPPSNRERMAAGIALTDADRQGWLHCIAGQLGGEGGLVVACSALKRSYRDLLRGAAPGVRFVHLTGPRALLEQRLAGRRGHYMPASLLQSQLDTLEPPADDERAITVDVAAAPARIVADLMQRLRSAR